VYEVELKLSADHDDVRPRLAAAGADSLGAVVQRDTYYDAPHRDFATTDEALRVRRVDFEDTTEARVTYKGPLVDDSSKTRREHETGVEDGETMAAVLEELGFSPAATVEKRRERFALDGHTVTLDAVTGLGEFVEVEGEATESEVEAVRESVYAVVRSLGLDPDDQIRTSYLELLLADSSE
jgi:adenylate cyclase class 2